ncbi:MAG: hypothetical protein A2931_00430 [Candidatus Niyogibacteria bacterium RIFCSPLOWO2_01_FULL_45_48]|uniref:Large ribosomal subunit protein bL25 n=2 Tax=Candidatus Niyogiibacteriota TaxID=1817912 RepID=A0A1G2F0L4_9BACT|nr:MAG: hypothetical protein A2931_00430 [Candidatus Niyogibacteria bacterium RIFCSPLOWO2_01_FULL_45_48]OGZ31595.1 MAG: hypothetical protein A3J00_00045 [Candidatus Niyogibacteria bacterium RIFCSPLOWO2_02_FULL_45_13]
MLTLKARARAVLGKGNKTLRKKELIPAVVYGAGEPSKSIELNLKDFQKTWKEAGESGLIELEMESEKKNVLIKDVQLDPVKDLPIHADFYAVKMDRMIEAAVPIKFIGESVAVKNLGANLIRVMHELDIEALPKDLPHELEVDISGLANFDDRFLVSDLKLPTGVKVLAGPEEIIALIEEVKVAEEVPAEAPSLEGIEVVDKKGKKEEEGAESGSAETEAKPKSETVEKKTKK